MSEANRSDIWQEVLAWLRVAESDRRVAQLCLSAIPPLHGVAAYHCQQAAEKLLKGLLVHAGTHVRKTHDLDVLADLVQAEFASMADLLAPLREWTAWSVAYRYPAEAGPEPEPSADELTQALILISRLEAELRSLALPLQEDGDS